MVLNLWCRKALSTPSTCCCQSSVFVCWISDAERRWARKIAVSQWIKGYGVLNLWCRKALSTTNPLPSIALHSRVESLMPKGVEHRESQLNKYWDQMCWISDAERRWALKLWDSIGDIAECWISDAERRWALMIAYKLYFAIYVLNLWCRKALSTNLLAVTVFVSCTCWISDAERRWAPIADMLNSS